MKNRILISGGTLVPVNELFDIISDGGVLIEDNEIIDFGKTSKLEKNYEFEQKIDATEKIIIPGLINTHHHLYSAFARGLPTSGKPAKNFIENLEKFWWKLDKNLTKESIYYSALVSLLESLKHGTTTIIDHHESQSCQKGALDEIARAVKEVGIRTSLCLGASDRYDNGEEGVAENDRFLSKINSKESELLHGMVGLHASFTVEPETLNKSVEVAKKHDVGIHFHCAEGEADQRKNMEKYNQRVVERLNDHGVLGEKSLAVHGVHLSEKEMNLLKKTNTNLVHNPESNMNNAVGYSDAPKMIEKGISVGLGTDGMSPDMLSQMRCSSLLHSHEKKDPRIGFEEAQKMLLKNNRKIVKKTTGWEVGKISKGSPADIILLDYHPYTPLTEDSFPGHLFYGLVNAPVDTVICNGEILVKDKKIVDFEKDEIEKKASKIATEIWENFQNT